MCRYLSLSVSKDIFSQINVDWLRRGRDSNGRVLLTLNVVCMVLKFSALAL